MSFRLPWYFILPALFLAGMWCAFLGTRHINGVASVLDRAETALVDLRIAAFGPLAPPSKVIIVAIDDTTVAKAGKYPLGRDQIADIVRSLKASGAQAVALDMLLLDQTSQDSENALALALSSLPSVIGAAGEFSGAAASNSAIPTTTAIIGPRDVFAQSAAVGLVNISTDLGGTPRHLPMLFLSPDGPVPSFTFLATQSVSENQISLTEGGLQLGATSVPLDLGLTLPLRYYGSRGTIRTISAAEFLDNTTIGKEVDLTDRLIVLGVTATAVGDRFSAPFDPILPGVEVLATGIANLLDGNGLIRNTSIRWVDVTATTALAAFGILVVSTLPLAAGSFTYLILLAIWGTVVTFAFGLGYWMSGALPLAGSVPPVLMTALFRQAYDRKQTALLEQARAELARFQSPALAERISEDPTYLSTPIEQKAAILFIDLAGYTGLSEHIGPARTRELLKSFHTLVVEETAKHGGVVLDFMGDGAMIIFGLPSPSLDDPKHALETGFALVEKTRAWISESGIESHMHGVRVGLHYGPVVVSRLGHHTQQQIAATGDSVNVASRLMEVGKSENAAIVVSSQIFAAMGGAGVEGYPLHHQKTVKIRGREQPMNVYF